LNDWIASDHETPLPVDDAQSNRYVFGRVGAAQPVEFRTMELSMIVLFGASVAWIVGVLLLKMPAARHVLSLLTLLLVVAVLSLRYSEQLQLLVQPAVLGFALAVTAVLIDNYFRRTRPATIVSVSAPGDFVSTASSSSSIDGMFTMGVGSEDPTAARSKSSPLAEPVSSSDSGSRL
jgi:hypothetical protein